METKLQKLIDLNNQIDKFSKENPDINVLFSGHIVTEENPNRKSGMVISGDPYALDGMITELKMLNHKTIKRNLDKKFEENNIDL